MSEMETGSCNGFMDWLFIILGTAFVIINDIIEELPKIIILLALLLIIAFWICFTFSMMMVIVTGKDEWRAFINYRMESEFIGINIIYPPMWCFYVLAFVCILFWLTSSDLMGLM